MMASQSPAPEHTLCSPSLSLSTSISGTWPPFKSPNPADSYGVHSESLFLGEEGGSCCSSAAPSTPAWRAVAQLACIYWYVATLSRKPTPSSLITAGFLALMPGNSAALRYPLSSCASEDPGTTLSHLGLYPTLPPECLSGRDLPYWRRLFKILILFSKAISLSCSLLMEPPAPLSLSSSIVLDSLLHISYLLESGHFSIWTVTAILRLWVVFAGVQNDLKANYLNSWEQVKLRSPTPLPSWIPIQIINFRCSQWLSLPCLFPTTVIPSKNNIKL